MSKGKTVFVGLSGGVDSSVAALRLQKQGYNVVGVFIKVWHPEFLRCNWEQERLDAMRVAAKLGIPFLTCDAQEAYKKEVADYFISEYQAGRTPNPDVMCNQQVKFGAFLEFARSHHADFVATGHYAQRILNTQEQVPFYELHRGYDRGKDQTYFLWTLTQKQLAQILFPIGDSTKNKIRKEAKKAGLFTANKKDSQGICFLGHIDIPEFLSHFVTLQEGPVLNEQGQTIGVHKGALVYTIGQRHGFTLTNTDASRAPHYVISRNLQRNTIVVSTQKATLQAQDTLTLHSPVYNSTPPTEEQRLQIQTRYRQQPLPAILRSISETSATLELTEQTDMPSAGQSCVLYDGTRCLGGGIIA